MRRPPAPTPPQWPPPPEGRLGVIVGVATGLGVVSLVAVVLAFYVARRRKMARMIEDKEFLGMDGRPYTFSYAELKAATDDFNPNNKLGEGGFGPVFKSFHGAGQRSLSLDWATRGYLAPEYAMRGHLTEKADVFPFGVVALEVVSGRPNSDPSLEEEKTYLLEW
ncbi:hypothetical protein NL676_028483, partial [Syzygium grande]